MIMYLWARMSIRPDSLNVSAEHWYLEIKDLYRFSKHLSHASFTTASSRSVELILSRE